MNFEEQEETILQEAERIIGGDRAQDYGDITESTQRIASMWSTILGVDVTPRQVLLCMVGLKISREVNKHKRDNLVDIAGYVRLLEKLEALDEDEEEFHG